MKNIIFTFNTMIEYLYSKLENICIFGFYLSILASIYYFINIFFKFPKSTGTILITIISILVLLALSLAIIFIIFSIYVIYLLIIIFIIGTILSFINKIF